jgi:hypothetical protein
MFTANRLFERARYLQRALMRPPQTICIGMTRYRLNGQTLNRRYSYSVRR